MGRRKIAAQGVCVGDGVDSAAGKRGGSSTMASYLPKKKKKIDGHFFGRRQLNL